MVTTSANPVETLRVSVFIYHREFTWAWHPNRPWWHKHGVPLWSEPDD